MAQQNITIGTADAKGGDTLHSAFTKTESNFTELYSVLGGINITFITQESDFPVQDATTITLEAQTVYLLSSAITTAKKFTVNDGAVLTALNILSPTLTYTGTGSMFTGVDASFTIREIKIDHPNAQGFSFTDTIGGQYLFLNEKVRTISGLKYGTFNDMQSVLIEGSSAISLNDGITVSGTNCVLWSVDKFFIGSSSASFIGFDMGSGISQTIEFSDFIINAPAGAYGLSGLAASGNVPTGRLAMVSNSEFAGGLTPLQNISVDDIRWRFNSNSPIPDTNNDALISLTSSTTTTTITTINTPVKVAGTFVCERQSQFTCDATGRATYAAERDITVPVDIEASIKSSSGTNKDVKIYLAKNGTVINNSGTLVRVDSTDTQNASVIWQLTLAQNDYLEIFIENKTDTTSMIVTDAVLRIR